MSESYDKRIGQRQNVADLLMLWQPVGTGARRRWVRRTERATAVVLDLSLSGARVAVDSGRRPLALGAAVTIGIDGDGGIAAVRRVDRRPGGGWIYGTEFMQLDSKLEQRISHLLMGDRDDFVRRWENYHGST